jgi:hypothetical protein
MGSPPEPVQRGSTPAPGRTWALPHRNPPGVADYYGETNNA